MRDLMRTAYATRIANRICDRIARGRCTYVTDALTKEPLTLNLLYYVSNAHEAGNKDG